MAILMLAFVHFMYTALPLSNAAELPRETDQSAVVSFDVSAPHETRPSGPWATRPATQHAPRIRSCEPVDLGRFRSVQVNVDSSGCNIVGDAANEPSIAVDLTDSSKIVIGWRQFDTVDSEFRQAGWAYSHDGGLTWTFPGSLTPGVFGSDPVLASNAEGTIYYLSISFEEMRLSRSFDAGVTWEPPVSMFPGLNDKPWMAIDTTNGPGRGNIYVAWTPGHGCCGLRSFTRSTDAGLSFMEPIEIPLRPKWGTVAVGTDGEVHVIGEGWGVGWSGLLVATSLDALDAERTPTFEQVTTLPGYPSPLRVCSDYPNLDGIGGQYWIAVDHSNGSDRGNLYALRSDYDLNFVRSTDGGLSWSEPLRINDDGPDSGAWQWFRTMAVAPNGRIDVIWNDTRGTACEDKSELYYAFSVDAGLTWSQNIAVSPPFDHTLGRPYMSRKLGDYYDMVSGDDAAYVAYAATFNGEQDVYFLRIMPFDCNDNGIVDSQDVDLGISPDCNGNRVPDECEPDCDSDDTPDVCDTDSDDDGVPDDCDNCPRDSNSTQVDCDNDGRGDVCTVSDCPANDPACRDCNGNAIPDACDLETSELEKLVSPNPSSFGYFGSSAAIDKGVLILGAPNDGFDSDDGVRHDGAAYVFRREGTNWTPEATLTGPFRAGYFGAAVSASSCAILIGAPRASSAVVFRRVEGTWAHEETLTAESTNLESKFGSSVHLTGDAAVIGAPDGDGYAVDSGSAFVFRLDASGSPKWTQEARLAATDGEAGDDFGYSIAMSGRYVFAGAPGNDDNGTNAGAVYVFRRAPDAPTWLDVTKLSPPDPGTYAGFGRSLSISRGTLVVGTGGGAAYVFRISSGDAAEWVLEAKLVAGDGVSGDAFGASVAISADTIVVGARMDDDIGSAYVFRHSSGRWIEQHKLRAADAASYDDFGGSVAVDDDIAVIGSRLDGENWYYVGSAHAFSLPRDCNTNGIPDRCESDDCNENGVLDLCQRGDMDGDRRVNARDFVGFHACLTGPPSRRGRRSPVEGEVCCSIVDFDGDGRVDLRDFGAFQGVFTGP